MRIIEETTRSTRELTQEASSSMGKVGFAVFTARRMSGLGRIRVELTRDELALAIESIDTNTRVFLEHCDEKG